MTTTHRLTKPPHLEVDELDGELLVLNVKTNQIMMLNAAGLELWKGLDVVETRAEAIELVKEALPQMRAGAVEDKIGQLIDSLIAGGFLEVSA